MEEKDDLVRRAESGEAKAQYELANRFVTMYYMMVALSGGKASESAENYYSQAAYWFKRAAEQGHSIAQFNIGECCFDGKGVIQNFREAFYWYNLAAQSGVAEAQYKLALCYCMGRGIAQDDYASFKWAEKAANQGSAGGQVLLATFYIDGICVIRNTSKAIQLLRTAYANGDEQVKHIAKDMLNDLGLSV